MRITSWFVDEKQAQPSRNAHSNTDSSSSSQKYLKPLDIWSRVVLGVAGLVLSAIIGWATYSSNRQAAANNQQAAERQIQNQIAALAAQRETAGAQLAASLLPNILHGSDSERATALMVLASVAPEQAEPIGKSVLPLTKSPSASEQIKKTIHASATAQQEDELAQHLDNAKKYRQFSLDASACREYFLAYESLQGPSREKLRNQIQSAKRLYDNGQFSEAANALEKILNNDQ